MEIQPAKTRTRTQERQKNHRSRPTRGSKFRQTISKFLKRILFQKPTTQRACTPGPTGPPGRSAAAQSTPPATNRGSAFPRHRVSVHEVVSAKAHPGVWIGVRTIQNARRHSLQLPAVGPNGASSRPVRAVTHPVPNSRQKCSPENARVKIASEAQDTLKSAKTSKNVFQGTAVGPIGQTVRSLVEEE